MHGPGVVSRFPRQRVDPARPRAAEKALRLEFVAEESFEDIIRFFLEDDVAR